MQLLCYVYYSYKGNKCIIVYKIIKYVKTFYIR